MDAIGYKDDFGRYECIAGDERDILGVKVPTGARRRTANGFTSFPSVTDLMVEFNGAPNEHAKLDDVARAFGHTGKNGDGAMFWCLFRDPSTRTQTIDYLANDLDMTHVVRVGLGFVTTTATADCPAEYPAV